MSILAYRFASVTDSPAVVELVDSAYRGETSLEGWTSEAHLLGGQRTDASMVSAMIADPAALVLLAEEDTALLACCELRQPNGPDGPSYFGMFAVRPGLQGKGLGASVLEEAERVVQARFDASSLEMTVIRQREDLIAWYERRGYRRTGDIRPFPYGDDRFGLPKVPDLEFVTLRKQLRNDG